MKLEQITSDSIGCTEEEAKLGFFTTNDILISGKYNLKFCSFLNDTDYPYICIYNSIYTDLDNSNDDLPTKILRLSLVFPAILRFKNISKYIKDWILTEDEFKIIFGIINTYWETIRKNYLISYLSYHDKCIDIPKESPYKNITLSTLQELHYIYNKDILVTDLNSKLWID